MLRPRFDPFRFTRPQGITQDERRRRITEAAYYRAKGRGFAPGHELEDWLAAERQVEADIASYWVRNYD